jgi:hypothetical protein
MLNSQKTKGFPLEFHQPFQRYLWDQKYKKLSTSFNENLYAHVPDLTLPEIVCKEHKSRFTIHYIRDMGLTPEHDE